MGQRSFFDVEDKLSELSKMGDPLEKLDQAIQWDIFKKDLKKAFNKERKSAAGRPAYDYLMMFKVLVLQTMYGLSDAQTQYQIMDRHTFKRFLGLSDEDSIPDEKTIWNFREILSRQNIMKSLFARFERHLFQLGYSAKKGQIVDASFVEVPKQRNNRQDNETVKQGKTPADWEKHPDKLCQKDVDARWTKKNGQSYYGYKDHVNVDVKHKMIREYEVTSANVHDSVVLDDVLDKDNTSSSLWADSAYQSKETRERLKKKRIKNNIHRKGNRSKALSDFQVKLNRVRSKIRVRVEHVFGSLTWMTGMYIRCIGIVRARNKIGMMNLVYNMRRLECLERCVQR